MTTRRIIPHAPQANFASYVLAAGEVVIDETSGLLYVGDGVTPGGNRSTSKWPRFDVRDVNGIDINGNNSSTAALQTAINLAAAEGVALFIPTGKIVCDAPIMINKAVSLIGDTTAVGRAIAGYSSDVIGPASRIHFAHSGQGIVMSGDGATFDGVLMRDLMFSRDQPAIPTSGTWQPSDHDYDLVMSGMAGLNLQNIIGLNPSRFVNMLGGGAIGRLFTDNVIAQPLITGVNVELAADVVRMSNTHFWPVWKDDPKVLEWTVNNCDHVWLKRCDTPMFTNFFSIAARSAFRIGKNASGTTAKMKVSNYDIDYSKYCIWFDSTALNSWARFSNGTLQANNSNGSLSNIPISPIRQNLKMDGISCTATFDGLEISGASGTAMDLGGDSVNNYVEVAGDFWVQNYGEAVGNTDPCIKVGVGSTFIRHGYVRNTALAAGDLIGGSGRIVGIRKRYGAGVTPQTGAYTVATLVDAEYIEDGYVVTGSVNVAINNAAGGSGYVDISLPTEIDITYTMAASDVTDGTTFTVRNMPGDPGIARVARVGGGNVAITGHTINLTFTYARRGI